MNSSIHFLGLASNFGAFRFNLVSLLNMMEKNLDFGI
ncbi:hypothetical protein ENROMA047B_07050 [Enterobacter rongchengensis]